MISSVTNSKLAEGSVVDYEYWCKNLVSPVLFNQAIQTIATDKALPSIDLLIEIGPHSALSGPIRQICISHSFDRLGYLPTLVRNEDAAAQLLKTAGELYLRGYKLDMERITSIDTVSSSGKIASTKGSILVDLPTYQWNYAKNLWAEPRQSAEHRAPRHDRHDILGRRVPGDSAHNPTWRNILRMRDMPWLRHHSLGGEVVFPAAGYFSMAMEEITQLNEDGPDSVQVQGYVLRDVSIKAALVTPDDDNGIETILTMQQSLHSEVEAQSTWWDFSVFSVSSDGHCRDHVTGTIAINARDRGQKQRPVPNLPQRSSGVSWNQALKDVGFDYGATFRDMNNIRSDGRNFVAASESTLKQDSGIMVGESRHFLHPSTLDSCLQLIIVSIYAGRMKDMNCGAVPIQVDEIAIWPPTPEQLALKKASVLSWTDQRGVRSFVSGSELVTQDGDVLLDIKDMRCVAYEAAAPPRLPDATKSQPYMHTLWKEDIDFLALTNSVENMDISTLVNLAAHKNPKATVLLLGIKNVGKILANSPLLLCTIAETSDEAFTSSQQLASRYKNANAQRMKLSVLLEEQITAENTYDLVITYEGLQTSELFRNVHKHLSSTGRFVLVKADHFAAVDTNKQRILLIYCNKADKLLGQVEEAAKSMGWIDRVSELRSCAIRSGEHVVLLSDLESPLLASLEEDELKVLQQISSEAPSVLWVTCGDLIRAGKPEHAMAAGLARSLTSENALLDLVNMDIELSSTPKANIASIIVAIVEKQLQNHSSHESEYYIKNGAAQISRLEPLEDLNLSYTEKYIETVDVAFDPSAHLSGKVQSGKVIFEADSHVDEALTANEVEVQVGYAGLNQESVAVINGTDYPTTFSHEIYGKVKNVGFGVENLIPGDHVFGFSFEKFGTLQRTALSLGQKAENTDIPEELATLPISYATALHGLGNVEEDSIVLILHGTGACGLAALSVCHWLKAKPFIVVRSQAEAEQIMNDYRLTKEQIIFSSVKSIVARLSNLTKGHGADVIFSSGSSDSGIARECWRAIAPFGRFVDFGRKNVLRRSVLDSLPLHHGASYHSYDLLEIYKLKPQILAKLRRLTYTLYRQKSIPAIKPGRINQLAELDMAVHEFSDSFAQGKTLITYEKSDKKLEVLPSRAAVRLRSDATYLLVGTLGGLGRSLGSWMMDRGAKHFTFMGRSGTDSEQSAILVEDMRKAGASVRVVRGDVTVRAEVDEALKGISPERPLRGVVHAAMVLRVCPSCHLRLII